MASFKISIVDKAVTASSVEEHASMDAARDSVVRAALLILLETHTWEKRRIAQCRIEDVENSRDAIFEVTFEITDFI